MSVSVPGELSSEIALRSSRSPRGEYSSSLILTLIMLGIVAFLVTNQVITYIAKTRIGPNSYRYAPDSIVEAYSDK